MNIKFEICDYTGESVVCKVTLSEAQMEKAEAAIEENPSSMFEVEGASTVVAETHRRRSMLFFH